MSPDKYIDAIARFIQTETGVSSSYGETSLREIVILTIAAVYFYSLVATKGEEKC